MTVELTSENFDAETQAGVVLVDFWAPWCQPCKALAPHIDAIATDYQGRAKVLKVDIDENYDLGARFNIKAVPTVLILKDGAVASTVVGGVAKSKIIAELDRVLQ